MHATLLDQADSASFTTKPLSSRVELGKSARLKQLEICIRFAFPALCNSIPDYLSTFSAKRQEKG